MQEAGPSGQNVEANLYFLSFINIADLNLSVLYQIHDAPVQPSIAHLYVKSGLIVNHRLLVVHVVDFLAQVEALIVRVQCVYQAYLVVLTDASEAV